ncbi:hypothetical protein LTR37_007309 [Vermiconidia calcicola]|uniref:Uncharacterized protein n=1 Tax=Vermiconidia calcicola TaxID=1690605 RepID=A0ACC3NF77_9PEZI|nr:hypothetical protein LTR37_007309 [Vermiconidia calcicola]
MPPSDSAALIVARFLKSNQYTESYQAFIDEAGLPQDAGNVAKGDLTLETLLDEKKTFDISVRFEKLGTADATAGWRQPAPSVKHAVDNLPASSNLLSTLVETFSDSGDSPQAVLLATSADRRLHILDAPSRTLRASIVGLQDSPILSCVVLRQRILLSTSMSGQLLASDLEGKVFDKRRDHSKYLVKVAVFHGSNTDLIATAGWDSKIIIYKPATSSTFRFGDPIATISLPTKPEALLFLRHPDNAEPILVATRTDSNNMLYYTAEPEPRLLGKQNLAPHSNAWVAFTPSALALCPTDETLIAVGTNSVPHMKLLIVRLLIPPYFAQPTPAPPLAVRSGLLDDSPATETQASQARAALTIADREDAAIQIHSTTMAPQTAYSTPAVAWRPDGSGVWVNGDDGVIRGIEASTGKVVSTLHGHEEGSKVRCLWAGMIDEEEEWLVSGGFDQKLIVWKTNGT